MTIKILKVDFRKGARRKCDKCPIARGCLRAARPFGYTDVSVNRDYAVFWKHDRGHLAAMRVLPNAARVAIDRFDMGLVGPAIPKSHFKPLEFEIEDLPRVA